MKNRKKQWQMQRRKDDLELLPPDSEQICKRCDETLNPEVMITLMGGDGFMTFSLLTCQSCHQKYVIPVGEYLH